MTKVEKQSKGLPAIALRFIYFAVALALFALAGITVYYKVNTPYTVFGIEGSPKGVADYVQGLIDTFKSGSTPSADTILRLIGFLAVNVYELVILIIAAVYVIILIVKLIIYASRNRDKEKLLVAFHRIEQSVVKVIFLFFIFDCFIKVAGGIPSKGFVLELVVLPLILVGNSLHKLLVEEFSGEGFDVQKLIYGLLEMVFLVGICAAVYFGLSKEVFFGDFINEFLSLIKSGSGVSPSMEFFLSMGGAIVRLVGYFLALSMLKPLIMYYPFNDKKGYEKASYDCTSSLLGKSIAALVLYLISGFVLYYVGKFESIKDAILAGPLMLVAIMGAAIALMIAHKANKPAKKDEEENKEEEKPEESSEEAPAEEKAEEEPAEEKPAKKGKKAKEE